MGGTTDVANCAVAPACCAVFATIENDLEVEVVPAFAREEPFEVFFCLLDATPIGQAPPLGEAMDMGIDRKGRHAKGLGQDNRCCFVTNAGQGFQSRHVRWNDPVIVSNE